MINLLHAKIHLVLHARSIRDDWRQKFVEICDGLYIKPEISETAVSYEIDMIYVYGNELSTYRTLAQLTKFSLEVKQLQPDAYVIECTAKSGRNTCGNYLTACGFILFTFLALFCNSAFGTYVFGLLLFLAFMSLLWFLLCRFIAIYLNKLWLRSLITKVVIDQGE